MFFEKANVLFYSIQKMDDNTRMACGVSLQCPLLGMTQRDLTEKTQITDKAVSNWERSETIANTEALKLLSKLFDVSINTLLGSPKKLICQCCVMPLDDSTISKEPDGAFNEGSTHGAY